MLILALIDTRVFNVPLPKSMRLQMDYTSVYLSHLFNAHQNTLLHCNTECNTADEIGFPSISGWYRGFSTKNRAVKGIFPSTYVTLKPCKIDNEGLFESVIPLEDPVVREVTLVLREWGSIWKRLYVVSIYTLFISPVCLFPRREKSVLIFILYKGALCHY